MAKRKYPYDLERIKQILDENQNRLAYEKVKEYIEGLFPETPDISEDDKTRRARTIKYAYKAAWHAAGDNGWIKPCHNSRIRTSGWAEEKRKKFQEYYERFADDEMARDPLFSGDFSGKRRLRSTVSNYARDLGIEEESKKKRAEARRAKTQAVKTRKEQETAEKSDVEEGLPETPQLLERKWSKPEVLEIPKEAWDTLTVRVGAFSRIDWKDKGARRDFVGLAFKKIFVPRGCHYLVLNGGMVSKRDIAARIAEKLEEYKDELHRMRPVKRAEFKAQITEHVLQEIANELNSIIPLVKKPSDPEKQDQQEFVRIYIMTSRILDGHFGETIGRILRSFLRPDVRLYKQGGARTRLKGVGETEEERLIGQYIGWLNPKKPRLPGQFASTAVDADIREEEKAEESHPMIWGVGGYGVSISKPGGGEKKRPRFSLPACSIPIPRNPGDPAVALNQIGVRVLEVKKNKEYSLETWSFRDIARDERRLITGIKDGATELHRRIVAAIANEPQRHGMHVGELSDALDVSREEIEKAIQFLVEPKALTRTTWPGLYKDEKSELYNFHLDWFQERLRYTWPYDKDWKELRRLIFGCLHAGYNTTDYEFVRRQFVKIILEFDIKVVELVGDITAGLKHHLIHRGQIIGNLNYTEQEILAAELLATVFYDVFVVRFQKALAELGDQKPSAEEMERIILEALVLFIYIVGNHEAWQKELGVTPGKVFKTQLFLILHRHITDFIRERGFFVPNLDEVIMGRIVELSEYNAVHAFSEGISTELLHPSMSRTKTLSIRAEEGLDFSNCPLVDEANFHTTVEVELWDPELGQRVAAQAGAMTPLTYFEHGKLKRVDFGPMYVMVRIDKKGRIFMVRHQFFNKPILKEPRDKDMDINVLKKELKLLRSPI